MSDTPAFSPFSPIEAILADIRIGKMVIVTDDADRENEGDLVCAAHGATAEAVNFMAKYGRGLICLTLTRSRCEQLRLPLMVSNTDVRQTTNFTISIEAAEGVTTGISAHDRARTIQAAVAPEAQPNDLRQPGHIFPLMAQPGGVLTRAGHTEAGCDLARLAGLEPAAVIVEILNDDGAMARRDDLLPSTGLLMRRTLFGGRGYGLDQLGTEESAAKLTAAQARELHRRIAVPNNGVLAIFGDVKAETVKAAIEKHFAGWQPNAAVKPGALPASAFALTAPQHVAEALQLRCRERA